MLVPLMTLQKNAVQTEHETSDYEDLSSAKGQPTVFAHHIMESDIG